MATIHSGNPYTHEEHSRTSIPNIKNVAGQRCRNCHWCGQQPRVLYQYDNTKGVFCNKECWRAFYV